MSHFYSIYDKKEDKIKLAKSIENMLMEKGFVR